MAKSRKKKPEPTAIIHKNHYTYCKDCGSCRKMNGTCKICGVTDKREE